MKKMALLKSRTKAGRSSTKWYTAFTECFVPFIVILGCLGLVSYNTSSLSSSSENLLSTYLDIKKSNQGQKQGPLPQTVSVVTERLASPPQSSPKEYVQNALVDCSILRQKHAHVADPNTKLANSSEFVAYTDKTPNPFYISLHTPRYDQTRILIKARGRYYETCQQDRWSEILQRAPPGVRILDVGGNIGYYSLFSASLGPFKVDTFEPNPVNNFRMCESLKINGWLENEFHPSHTIDTQKPTINVWQLGISEAPGTLDFDPYPSANPGAGSVVKNVKSVSHSIRQKLLSIDVTTLDEFAAHRGWFDEPQRIEIMKVDVEKHETEVLMGASKLLKTKQIRHVFAEVTVLSAKDRTAKQAALQQFVDAGYILCCMGGFKGPTEPVELAQDEHLVRKVLDGIGRSPKNLWWQAEGPCWRPRGYKPK